jgi:hypothetical protein
MIMSKGRAFRFRQRTKQAKLANAKLAKRVKADGETPLAVMRHKIEVHRLFLYSNLPLQEGVEDHRLRTRNGFNLRGMATVQGLARIADLTIGEMSRKYAARNY